MSRVQRSWARRALPGLPTLGQFANCTRTTLAYASGGLIVLGIFLLYSRDSRNLSFVTTWFTSRVWSTKTRYVEALLREPVEGELDPHPIVAKCTATRFQPGLVWQCAAVNGGIGNVANMLLNCVRYALEAGATILILPRLSIRSPDLYALGDEAGSGHLSSLIDIPYFQTCWKQVCPQMQVALSDSEIPNLPSVEAALHLSPDMVKEFPRRKYLVVDPTGWREAFDTWLHNNPATRLMSKDKPVRVWQNLAFAQWNREAHPADFARTFPRLFRHAPEMRSLAASALWRLEQRIAHPVVPTDMVLSPPTRGASTVNALPPGRLVPNSFLGAHLRVAADAAKAGWPGYDAQAPFYIAEAKARNLTTIYLATGSASHRQQFRGDAEREGILVLGKEDLLDGPELEQLEALTWDQQALVDFDVLMHSAVFYGFVRSTFSWLVALRRGLLTDAGMPVWGAAEPKLVDEYRDNISAIAGRFDQVNPEGMWP